MKVAREAEEYAALYLQRLGYAIRARNWRPHPAPYEVDIIAQQGNEMVFVEVKGRQKGDMEEAINAVDLKKQKFIARAANIFLQRQEHLYYYRFDIMALTKDGHEWDVKHIKDAFMPPLTTGGAV